MPSRKRQRGGTNEWSQQSHPEKKQKKWPVRKRVAYVDPPKQEHPVLVDPNADTEEFPVSEAYRQKFIKGFRSSNQQPQSFGEAISSLSELKLPEELKNQLFQKPEALEIFRHFQNTFKVDNELHKYKNDPRTKRYIMSERPLEQALHSHGVRLSMESPNTTRRLIDAIREHKQEIPVKYGEWESSGGDEIHMNPNDKGGRYVVGRHPQTREMMPIPQPPHIAFAHEAKHTLDHLQGRSSNQTSGLPLYTNPNEVLAIGKKGDFKRGDMTENAFREEAERPLRYGHFGWDQEPKEASFRDAIAPYVKKFPKHLLQDQDFYKEYRQA